MRKINTPEVKQSDIFDAYKTLEYLDRLVDESKNYCEHLKKLNEFEKDEHGFIGGNIDYKEYMKKMYSQRFTSSSKSYEQIYKYYKKIRLSQDVCPYCNYFVRKVKQVDHFLPKAHFPTFAITVNNLVPICKECNETKDDYYSIYDDENILHPYYDEIPEDISSFLKCHIVEDGNIGFNFSVKKLDCWSDNTFRKFTKHFEVLKLNDLYRDAFSGDFVETINELKISYKESKELDQVKRTLTRRILILEMTKIKPWSVAGLKALNENDWFLNVYLPTKLVGI